MATYSTVRLNVPTIQLLVGRSNVDLGGKIVEKLKKKISSTFECGESFGNACSVKTFANTEVCVEFTESFRDCDVFIIQTGCAFDERSINDHVMEMMMMIDGCVRSDAKKITVISPCFPYARSDKRDHRGPVSSKMVVNFMAKAGANRIVAIDLHSGQIQPFADIPFDNLYAIKDISKYLIDNTFVELKGKDNCILVSPDAGGIKRIRAYSKLLKMNHVTLEKQRNYTALNTVDKSILVGDPSLIVGKIAIMIDDMIDTAGTMIKGAEELMSFGAKGVILIATHGILSHPAIERINSSSYVLKVIVTNSIQQTEHQTTCPKLEVVDLSDLFVDVITRLQDRSSISELFEHSYMEKEIYNF